MMAHSTEEPKKTTIRLPRALEEQVLLSANADHRSFNKQVLFLIEQGLKVQCSQSAA